MLVLEELPILVSLLGLPTIGLPELIVEVGNGPLDDHEILYVRVGRRTIQTCFHKRLCVRRN